MNISHLLAHRAAYLQKARLANLAYAHETLRAFADRLAQAGITGRVRLQSTSPDDERYLPTLTALDSHQSVIEEHFTDDDVIELTDLIGFVSGEDDIDMTLSARDVGETLLVPVRFELESKGVKLTPLAESAAHPPRQA